MIKYTITPYNFNKESSQLHVELIPEIDTVSSQHHIFVLSKELLEEIKALPSIEAQKARTRKYIVSFNSAFQQAWEQELAAKDESIPAGLFDLIGVPGTTPVTEEEVNQPEITVITSNVLDV